MFEASYVDNRAIKGQAAVNYIMHSQEIHDKFQKAWFHFLVSGETYNKELFLEKYIGLNYILQWELK